MYTRTILHVRRLPVIHFQPMWLKLTGCSGVGRSFVLRRKKEERKNCFIASHQSSHFKIGEHITKFNNTIVHYTIYKNESSVKKSNEVKTCADKVGVQYKLRQSSP